MFIICDKETGAILGKIAEKTIVDDKWVRVSAGCLIQLDFIDIFEVESTNNKTYYHDGKLSNLPASEFRANKKEIMSKLLESDSKMIRLVDELMEFCEGLGYSPDSSKKILVAERKELRKKINNL